MDRRQARGAVGRMPDDPFQTEQVVGAVGIRARAGTPAWRGRTRTASADGRRSSAAARPIRRRARSASARPVAAARRPAASPPRRRPPTGSGAEGLSPGQSTGPRRARPDRRYHTRRWPPSTPPRASTTSSSSATRSSCTTRSPRSRSDPRRAAAFRTIAGNERRHAEVWASKLRDLGRGRPAARQAPAAGPVDHPAGSAVSGRAP